MSVNGDYPQINSTENIENLYKMPSPTHTSEISSKFETVAIGSLNSEELSECSLNLKSLTSYMKETLENEQSINSSSRSILGHANEALPRVTDEEKLLDKASMSHLNHILRTSLVETNVDDLQIRQSDPNDPLYSVTSFKDLNISSDLLRGILSLNFRKPSGIQERALPMLLDNPPKNLIAQSQSGTGKTATFLLTMLSRINVDSKYCQCLCMAPTRELAIQIADVAMNMSKYMSNLTITCAIKGQVPPRNGNEVESHIVIGTPGTIKYWTSDDSDIFINPRKVKVFVLDEADVLMENNEFLNISKRIKSKLTKDCQILLFSATYDDRVIEFAREFVPSPNEISIKSQELTLKNIKQYYIEMDVQEKKYTTLIDIFGIKPIGQCIIFCESRRMAGYLQRQLEKDGHLSSLLSGELDVLSRENELNNFRSGKSRVLIATNVCSRGIDIPQVNLIVNWDMPRTREGNPDCETYLHRIGRSGRFGKTGLTINFIMTPADRAVQESVVELFGTHILRLDDLEVVASIK